MNILKRLLPYLWSKSRPDLNKRVILSLTCLVLGKLLNVMVPFFYKGAIDQLSKEHLALILPLGFVLAYGLARVFSQAFGELRDFLFIRVSQNAQRVLALKTFEHLHSMSLQFHLDRQTGGLTRAIDRGTKGIQYLLSFMLFNIIPTLFEILLVTGILYFTFGWWIATITFATLVGYIAYTLGVTEFRLKYRKQMNETDNEASTKAIDSLLNYETVKYFNNEKLEFNRFDKALARYETAAVRSQSTLSLLNVGQGAIIGVGLIAVMYLTAKGIQEGKMTVGDFVLANTYLIQLYMPLGFLGFVYREIKQSLLDMDQMFKLLDMPKDVQDLPNAYPLIAKEGRLEFRNVTFGYGPDRVILKDLSFVIEPGQTVAVVGPSGSGKSTLVRLLFRFYDLQGGKILFDGSDIKEVTQASLRRAIGVVPQDCVLFNDTIEYNLQYGNPEATPAQLESAAKLAQIDGLITKLPQGYQTRVGERGLKLSGGEKQRVAIARTILKDPRLLILDEATSALDSQTEKDIQHAIDLVSKNRTTLAIAHRLSTIVDADQILVLQDGVLLESGRHEDLLRKNGAYAALWHKQQEAHGSQDAPSSQVSVGS